MIKSIFMTILISASLSQASDTTPEIRAVHDESNYKPHIGVSAGISNPEGSFRTGDTFSLEFGLQPVIPFSYSVKVNYADYYSSDQNFSRTSLILEGKYNFGGDIPLIKHSYVGAGIGPAWEVGSIDDGIAIALYPQAGFDLPLNDVLDAPLSVGFNVNYLVSTRTTPDTYNATGVVKYWY